MIPINIVLGQLEHISVKGDPSLDIQLCKKLNYNLILDIEVVMSGFITLEDMAQYQYMLSKDM